MKGPIAQSTALELAQCHFELSNPEDLLRRMKDAVVQSTPRYSSGELGLVGALQDLLTSRLPSERRRTSFGTDFGAGPPPLLNA